MIQNTDVSQRAATHKTSRSLDIASVQASLDTLKGLSSPSQKRQDALVKLTKARDELRSYLRFMMFLLSPEKRSQLAAILTRIEALIASGASDPCSTLAQSNSETAVVIHVSTSQGSEGFFEQTARLLAQMRKLLNKP
jgi:hypothetical protein